MAINIAALQLVGKFPFVVPFCLTVCCLYSSLWLHCLPQPLTPPHFQLGHKYKGIGSLAYCCLAAYGDLVTWSVSCSPGMGILAFCCTVANVS